MNFILFYQVLRVKYISKICFQTVKIVQYTHCLKFIYFSKIESFYTGVFFAILFTSLNFSNQPTLQLVL